MATFFDRRNTYLLNAETLRFGQDRLGINEHLKKLFCMRFNSLVAIEVRLGYGSFLKWAILGLFFFYFWSNQTNDTIFTTI